MNQILEVKKVTALTLFLSFFVFFAVVSLVFMALSTDIRERRVILLDNDIIQRIEGVPLGLAKQQTAGADIESYLQVLLALPYKAIHRQLFGGTARVVLSVVANNVAYIDLNMDVAQQVIKRVAIDSDLRLVKRALEFNFPGVSRFVITVNGFEPIA